MKTLLAVEQYADITQLHPDSVRRQLRAVKKGRVWRIPSDAVDEETPVQKSSPNWKAAANRIAPIYQESLRANGKLTGITTAPGEFYDTGKLAK